MCFAISVSGSLPGSLPWLCAPGLDRADVSIDMSCSAKQSVRLNRPRAANGLRKPAAIL